MYDKATIVCFIYKQSQKLKFKFVQINMKHLLYMFQKIQYLLYILNYFFVFDLFSAGIQVLEG